MRSRTYALLLLIIAFAVLAAACAEINSEGVENGATTTVATQDASTTSTQASTTTVPAPTTTTTTVPDDKTEESASGMLLVTELPDWQPSAFDGELVRNSWMCSVFDSETEAYEWIQSFLDDEGNFIDLVDFNAQYDAVRIADWERSPRAARNMLKFLAENNPSLIKVLREALGEEWRSMSGSSKMSLIERVNWTDKVSRSTSFRTTWCDNDFESIEDLDFRTVGVAQNVTISPEDPDVIPTLMDIFSPALLNEELERRNSDARVFQIQREDGTMTFEVRREGEATVVVKAPGVVNVYMQYTIGGERVDVKAVAVFSTVCGQPPLPEYQPSAKTPTTTSTTSTTTTTVAPTTTTTVAPTTTTTVAPTTTTSPATTTTTAAPLTGTFKPELVGPAGGPWKLALEKGGGDFASYFPKMGSTITEGDLNGESGGLKWLTVVGTRKDGTKYSEITNTVSFGY